MTTTKYTVTTMAQKLGVAPAEVNSALAQLGLQEQVTVVSDLPGAGKRRKWVATEKGSVISELRKGNKGLNAYEILLWDYEVMTMLGFVKPPSRVDFDALQAETASLKEEAAATRRQVWLLSDQVQVLQGQVQLLTGE